MSWSAASGRGPQAKGPFAEWGSSHRQVLLSFRLREAALQRGHLAGLSVSQSKDPRVPPPPPSEGSASTCARQPLRVGAAGECGSHLYIKPPISCDAERVGVSEMDVFCQG